MNTSATEKSFPFTLTTIPGPLHDGLKQHWSNYLENTCALGIEPVTGVVSLPKVWCCSDFVARSCSRNPALLTDLVDSGDLERLYKKDDLGKRVAALLAEITDEESLKQRLRQSRNREMVRIAWRDLSDMADLGETLADLSSLAKACVQQASAWCYRQLGEQFGTPRNAEGVPQQLLVLAMGKLGGGELNFSSDIDLIFVFPENGQTDGARALSNSEFFVRLGQRLIKILNDVTADGFVFRVDMRLRPFGEAGPLATSFDALEGYYQAHGREWERYALIKARAITGDEVDEKALQDMLRPFIYRRYLDFGAFESLRDMKRLIRTEVQRKGLDNNIKLGAGGIREIEFIGQAFQLIRGGRDPELQARGIRVVLKRLGGKGLLPDYTVHELLEAYTFLRRAENHLQMLNDEQAHTLPNDEMQRLRLAYSMGYVEWPLFLQDLEHHRQRVSGHFDQVFAAPQLGDEPQQAHVASTLTTLWQAELPETQARQLLADAGFDDASAVLAALVALRDSRSYKLQSEQGRERMDRLMPLLIGAAGQHESADRALLRVLPLIEAVARRSVYMSLLAESPLALSQLVKLSAASSWIPVYLERHPILLDELLDPRTLYAPPNKAGLIEQLRNLLEQVDAQDVEEQMDRLRQFKHASVLRVAAADVMETLPLMKVSDHLTWIAEVVLDGVYRICSGQLITRHGKPHYQIDGQVFEPGFAVVGYGKLGGIELGYGSDLDIVFVHDSQGQAQVTDGDKPLDNAVFFARLAQRMIHMLTTFTPAGVLYEIDTRLRPSGGSGLLVTSLQAYERYQQQEAWTWEHQALARARIVAGDERLISEFQRIRQSILCSRRDGAAVRKEVCEMRAKMWNELGNKDRSRFDLKKDQGGIADIEFMVQYYVLAYAEKYPSLVEYTDNMRMLDSLAECQLMAVEDVRFLQDAYRAFRDALHALSLQDLPSTVDAAQYHETREKVRRIWHEVMEPEV